MFFSRRKRANKKGFVGKLLIATLMCSCSWLDFIITIIHVAPTS